MRYYTVHLRDSGSGRGPDLLLVKEGFCWPALVVPVLWLIWRGLWLGLLAYVAAALALGALTRLAGLGAAGEIVVGMGFAVLVAAHANDWRRLSLGRRGYREIGVVAGPDVEAALRRLFAHWRPGRPLGMAG